MTPGARLQASIELLEAILNSLEGQGSSADVLIQQYFRTRRYAGSKDRAAVREIVYDVIRALGRYRRLLSPYEPLKQAQQIRLFILLLVTESNHNPDELYDTLFNGDKFSPPVLTNRERDILRDIAKSENPEEFFMIDDYAPSWLLPAFQQRFQYNIQAEMTALNGRAPLDIRCNTLKSSLKEVSLYIENKEIIYEEIPHVPSGLRLPIGTAIKGWDLYTDGKIEIQDAAAQIAMQCCDLQAGQTVIDLCAGAGGKSLAAAALMQNQGQIIACDVSDARLDAAKPRIARAGASIIKLEKLSEFAMARQKALHLHANTADRVLLDVPCSGTGVWRRNPESKWRFNKPQLQSLQKLQYDILREGADIVKPGGQIIYMTCSLLPQENEDQIKAFLKDRPDFTLCDYQQYFAGKGPQTAALRPECLQLTPFQHNTDGFFVAIMQKESL